jgi:hypothetical protein
MKIPKLQANNIVLLACLALIAFGLFWSIFSQRRGTGTPTGPDNSQTIANVPGQASPEQNVPPAQSTIGPTLSEPTSAPGVTGNGADPTYPVPTTTPGPMTLQPAKLVTPAVVGQIIEGLQVSLTLKSTLNSTEPLRDMAWAPTGDKVVYLTTSGKLYSSREDGTDAQLLHTYEPDSTWGLLQDQSPKANVLLIPRAVAAQASEQQPGSGGMDLIRFSPGQRPVREEVPGTEPVFNIRWWRADRASGTRIGSYVGGDKLVTLGVNGRLIEERNIPYMQSGAVRPGGDWLAYVTSQQTTATPLYGSEPETAYLLNLNTGERLQITPAGRARNVQGWSPDGRWLLLDAFVNDTCGAVLFSADARELLAIHQACGNYLYDATWSPNSKRLAFSIQGGGCDSPNQGPCPEPVSKVYVVDPASRQIAQLDIASITSNLAALAMKPKWSPDGSSLALLSFDPACPWLNCSTQSPAMFLLEDTSGPSKY